MSKAVIVVDYDPAWPAMFEQLHARIWPAISDVATSLEHVGSTAVPGLAAKPVIDMTIVVPTAEAMATVIARLATIGYRHCGDLGIPGREMFARPADASVAHHLYACVADNPALRNHLTLRDHLRRDPSAAQAYGVLKRQLAARFPRDIDAYIEGKTDFILAILAGGDFSQEQLGAIRLANERPGGVG